MRLKQERIRVGLSLPELGAIGGVAADAQDDFETGRQSPLADYLARILSTGIDVVYVLTGRPLPPAGRKNMDGVSDPADSVFELYQRQTSLLAKLSEEGGDWRASLPNCAETS
jgi:transcriptional regulator with XRE-family HTH domain